MPSSRSIDSTQRRLADQLGRVFEEAPLGVVLFDRELRVLRANAAFAEMLASTTPSTPSAPAAVVGRTLHDLTLPEDRAAGDDEFERLRRREVAWVTVKRRLLREDGSTWWAELATRIFWGPTGELIQALAIVRDISEAVRKEAALRDSLEELEQTQARLQLADRPSTVDTLAANAAHEINNPLSFVVANLAFAQEALKSLRASRLDTQQIDNRLNAFGWALSEAQEGANRVRNVVLNLKALAGMAEPDLAPASVDAAQSGARPRRARVLVVDDEILMGSAIARVLTEHEVIAMTSGRTAMAKIAAGDRFDVILCDVRMPDFSGIDLYRGIAACAPELLGRIVFVTGGAFTADAAEFLDGVANLRLEKPIHPDALHDVVAAMMATGPAHR